MTTFDLRLAGNRKDLKLWLVIQGIGYVFKSRVGVDASTILGETYTEVSGALIDADEGGESVDFEQQAVTGGSLSFKLVQAWGQTFLDDTLRQRQRKIGWLTDDLSTANTTIKMNDTSTITAGDIIYIGEESILVGTVASGTDLTGCTREKFGSRARPQKSSSSTLGAAVYAYPTGMVGRRVSLYGSFCKDDGTSSAALTKLLNTYVIEEAPEWVDERCVSFRCGPILDEHLDAPLYVGVREVGGGRVRQSGVHADLIACDVDDADAFTLPDSTFPTFALLTRENLGTIARIYYLDSASTPNKIEVYPDDQLDPPGLTGVTSSGGHVRSLSNYYASDHARHIALVSGATGTWALWLLTSRLGDAANGAYDVLPGKERVDLNDAEFRFGAGIDVTDMDVDAFTAVSGRWVTFPLMRECKSGDVVREVCWATESVAYSTSDGQLSLLRMGDNRDTPTVVLDDSYAIAGEHAHSWVDEDGIYPRVTWRLNYDPNQDRFTAEHVTIDSELMQRYPRREKALVIESRGMGLDLGAAAGSTQQLRRAFPMSVIELDQVARSMQVRGGRGRLMVRRKFKIGASVARIGDVVTLSFDAADHNGGTVLGRNGRVVGRRPSHIEGWCELTIEVFESVYRLAPSCVVTARTTVSIANDTLTLSTTAPDAAGASPQDDFHVGQTVRIWDVSAGSSTTRTIAAILSGPPRLRFTAAAPAIEANRDWLTWDTLGTSSGTSGNGDDEGDWIYFMAASGVAAEGDTRRWT